MVQVGEDLGVAEQEDRVETLRKEIAGLVKQEQEARKALDEYLLTVTLE